MSNPAVSIVMPSYNAAGFILPSIASVIAQSYSDWELLIVDDASHDDTVACVNAHYGTEPRVRIITLPTNQGAAVARNTAIDAARGRYIAFLDCDDQWLPHKLEYQLQFMAREGCAFSFTAYEKVKGNNEVVSAVGVPARTTYHSMLKTSVVGCSTAMYDTQHFGKVLMPLVRMRQDFGLWLALLKRVPHGCGIQEVLVRYNVRSDSISSNKRRAALYTWRVYRQVEKLPLPTALWCFGNYAFRGFLRHRYPRVAQALGFMHLPHNYRSSPR
ncbi:glycosyltransferase family 2 protein [Pseudomonas viridiflava]|uniref:glycosyltransferase family 2 protein n=1 Tax=Pseudomonas viridiflava TaxID=33069 RepID=UPI000F055401|nr:glycosyltransferase family 2 protein [Pseudomonas viridiflava]